MHPYPLDLDATQTQGPTAAPGPAADGPGTIIAHYKLLQLIGEGGMGAVYMAEQVEPIRRMVAVKVIKLGMDSRQVIARFEAERQALAMMDHPNIAKALDAGTTDSGRPYFVMELVKGVPITQYCDANRLDMRTRLALFIQVARAVQHAHQKGIIHRDIKPSNVMVTLHDGTPMPKVIDFGIAKATQTRLTEKTLYTEYRQLIGTPAYMAPEQAEISGLDVDTRADIYSLGVLLYELLTGTTPLDAQRLQTAGYAEMQRMIREEEPPLPSTRLKTMGEAIASVAAQRGSEPARLRHQLRGELDWIVMRCLEKDRTRRYDTAAGLANDVQRFLDNEPVLARPAGTAYRARKFIHRHHVGVTAAGAVGAFLVLGIIGTTAGMWRATRAQGQARQSEIAAIEQRDRAEGLLREVQKAQAHALREASRSRAAHEFLRDMLSAAQPGTKGPDVKVADVLSRASAQLWRLQDEPEVEMDARITLGRTYMSLSLFGPARENINRVRELARSLHGPDHEQSLDLTADLAWLMAVEGEGVLAQSIAQETVQTAQRLLGRRHPVTFNALNSLGVSLLAQGNHPAAESVLADLVKTVREMEPGDRPARCARFYGNLSLAMKANGRLADAEALQREALEIDLGGQDAQRRGRTQYNLAMTLWDQARLTEAEAAFRQAIEEQHRRLGELHPDTRNTFDQMTRLLQQMGRFEEALPMCEQQLRSWAGVNVSERWKAITELEIASMHQLLGHREQAERAYAEGMARLRQIAGVSSPELRECWADAVMNSRMPFDKSWAGPGIRRQVFLTTQYELYNHGYGPPAMDAIITEDARFKLLRWTGAASPPIVCSGGWEEFRNLPDPPPGVYLLSIALPRRNGPTITAARWMLLNPWNLELHRAEEGERYTDEAKWQALFKTSPVERRIEANLCFLRRGPLQRGFGPAGRAASFALAGLATVSLPAGRYWVGTENDGMLRTWVDGQPVVDTLADPPLAGKELAFTAAPVSIRVEATSNSTCRLLIEPRDPPSDTLIRQEAGVFGATDAEIDRLTAELVASPGDLNRIEQRGLLYAGRGMFAEAAADLTRSAVSPPAQHFRGYRLACLYAFMEDTEAYRSQCAALLEACRDATQREVFERTAKACLLLPGLALSPEQALRLADQALEGGEHELKRFFLMARGLAAYRAGRHEEAVAALDESLRAGLTGHVSCGTTAELILAMARHRLGQERLAREVLGDLRHRIATRMPTAGEAEIPPDDLENWLVLRVILKEAEALIEPAGPKSTPGRLQSRPG